MKRNKLYVEFPLAGTLREAIKFMKNGGLIFQECSDDFPMCGGFNNAECLIDNFPEEDWDYDEDNQSLYLHLVPKEHKNDNAEPFRVEEEVWATEELFDDSVSTTKGIYNGDCNKILEIKDGKIRVDAVDFENSWWDEDKFCRCILPIGI